MATERSKNSGTETDERNEEIDQKPFMDGFPTVNLFTQSLLADTFEAVKSSNAIDSTGTQADIYNTYENFRKLMRIEGMKVLSLMNGTLQHQVGKGSFVGLDVEDMFEQLVDINDVVLERAGISLDEAAGLRKPEETLKTVRVTKAINTSWNRKTTQSSPTYQLLAGKNISRPQMKFKDKINNSHSPFEPIIKYKPNSIKPLSILIEVVNDEEIFSHPYELEIDRFCPSQEQLEAVISEFPKPLEETPFVYISTLEGLQNLCDQLKKTKEFAVDLEHHSYRSFQGITCLMQISTRMCDYVIDVLLLRSELCLLNEVFTDPRIVKVLHGANMDIQWLQRDFGLYIVNLFDTGQASRVLGFHHFSLSYLMKLYCHFEPDKQIRLADWRMRPLPNEMLRYAREDTHYLLYIYDQLKSELIAKGNESKNLLISVFQRSKEICLIRYRKPCLNEDSFLDLYRKSKKNFNARQLFALKQLYAWRDGIARAEDESIGYVLPNHMMLQISEVLPREQQGILACCNPIPPLVRQQMNEIHVIILKARESPLAKLRVEKSEVQPIIQSSSALSDESSTAMINCPHDLLSSEGAASYPTMLDDCNSVNISVDKQLIKKSGLLSSCNNTRIIERSVTEKMKEVEKLFESFVSPYQKMKAVIAKLQEKEKEQAQICSNIHPSEPQQVIEENEQVQTVENSENKNQIDRIHDHFMAVQEKQTRQREEGSSDERTLPMVNMIKKSRKRKRKEKTGPSIELVKPFDYSATDKTAFKGNASSVAQKHKKHFNPEDSNSVQLQSKSSRRRKNKGKRITYTKQNQKGQELRWPSKK